MINELGSGERLSLAKFCVRFLASHSRPPRIAIDVSIWLFQAQAGRGGANPELRTLFFRLARLVALPVHPLFVFDGPERPAYKRGKLIQRSGNGAGWVLSLAKRLIELFRFPWHAAPGEAEAECAKLQAEGVVDAVMSDDVDAIMFGSTVTMRNFSRESAKSTSAATHINVCRTADTKDGEANVHLDQGGMILFAMLSGGDYLPAGVPRCGPKLAGEISIAKFGTDLLEIVRESASDMDQKLSEWRERLEYELHTNESGYFRCRHKAVHIPETFPDTGILLDYVCPVTSTRSELKRACSTWVWDRDLDVQELRAFICEELRWNYLLGAKRLIRTIAPRLVAQRLRLGLPIVPGNEGVHIANRRDNFGLDGMSEFKLKFVPADVVELDWESERPPLSSQGSEIIEEDSESEAAPDDNEGTTRKNRQHSYDPKQPDSAWILESMVTQGLPDMVASWHAEQEKKKAQKSQKASRVSKKRASSNKGGPKVLDPSMKPGAILRFGTIVKGPAGSNTASPNSTPISSGKPFDSYTMSPGASQLSNAPASSLLTQRSAKSATSGDIEAAFNYSFNEDGISPPSSPVPEFRDPNELYSLPRSIDEQEDFLEHLQLSPSGGNTSPRSTSDTKSSARKGLETSLLPASERSTRSRKQKTTSKENGVVAETIGGTLHEHRKLSSSDGNTILRPSKDTTSSSRSKSKTPPPPASERRTRSLKQKDISKVDCAVAEKSSCGTLHEHRKLSSSDNHTITRPSRDTRSPSRSKSETAPPSTGERRTRSRKPKSGPKGNDAVASRSSKTVSTEHLQPAADSDISIRSSGETKSSIRGKSDDPAPSPPAKERNTRSRKLKTASNGNDVTVRETLSTTRLSTPGVIPPQDQTCLNESKAKHGSAPKSLQLQKTARDAENLETKRRLSGIIETKNGFWTYRPKNNEEATLPPGETGSSISRENAKGPGKSKRLARVSILDLT